MTIASNLLQRHIQTLVDDNATWQTLISDDISRELALCALHRSSSTAIRTRKSGEPRNMVRRGC